MEIKTVHVDIPEGENIIIGQSHFIKTVPDLYELLVASSPHLKFGIAFSEASGHCLVRHEGNDEGLEREAVDVAFSLACGHVFVICLKEGFPINVLNAVKMVPEVCRVFCATANSTQVLVAETTQGRGIVGVVDGLPPKGVEGAADIEWRRKFLRQIGYKL